MARRKARLTSRSAITRIWVSSRQATLSVSLPVSTPSTSFLTTSSPLASTSPSTVHPRFQPLEASYRMCCSSTPRCRYTPQTAAMPDQWVDIPTATTPLQCSSVTRTTATPTGAPLAMPTSTSTSLRDSTSALPSVSTIRRRSSASSPIL